jgi:hypothetical protein
MKEMTIEEKIRHDFDHITNTESRKYSPVHVLYVQDGRLKDMVATINFLENGVLSVIPYGAKEPKHINIADIKKYGRYSSEPQLVR